MTTTAQDLADAKMMTAKYDGICPGCGDRISARRRTDIALVRGVAICRICHGRASHPDAEPASYIRTEPAVYIAESRAIAQRVSVAVAQRAERKAHRPGMTHSGGVHPGGHHPDCDARIRGNPCTCAYED